jgi:1,4-alpha-glucan branching enzyme
MIWMGQEFAMANDKNHAEPRPLDWSLLNNERNADLQKYTANLVRLRLATPAMMTDGFEVCLLDHGRQVLAYKRWNTEGGVVVVMANFRDDPPGRCRCRTRGLEDGDWQEQINHYDTKVQGGVLRDTLGPSEVKVFVKR